MTRKGQWKTRVAAFCCSRQILKKEKEKKNTAEKGGKNCFFLVPSLHNHYIPYYYYYKVEREKKKRRRKTSFLLSTAESSCGEYTRQEYTYTDWFDYSPLAFDILFIIIALLFHLFVLSFFFFSLYIRGSFTRIVHHHLRRRWGLCVTFCFFSFDLFFFLSSFSEFYSFFFSSSCYFTLLSGFSFFFKVVSISVFLFFSSPFFFLLKTSVFQCVFYSVTDKLDFFHFLLFCGCLRGIH